MRTENEPLQVAIQVVHPAGGSPFSDVLVEVLDERDGVAAQAVTGADGLAVLEVPADRWNQRLSVRVAGQSGPDVVLSREDLNGDMTSVLSVTGGDGFGQGSLELLADQLVATRKVRADDLAGDLATPSTDSLVRLLPAADRARLLDQLERALQRTASDSAGEDHLVDPEALRRGRVKLVAFRDVQKGLDVLSAHGPDLDPYTKPGVGWELFDWSKPDDQSYRDYLRSVFVLFVHQQKLGRDADPATFPAIVERQLTRRFFQDFRTTDRTEVPLNRLLVPIVTAILTARIGSGFGFGIAPATLPAQGTRTDRQQLDALLALAKVSVQEFANRYRLPLTEPDSAKSSRVLLNIHTLSRALSDTAQGPIEPPDNVIEPQLPGEEGKPILWSEHQRQRSRSAFEGPRRAAMDRVQPPLRHPPHNRERDKHGYHGNRGLTCSTKE